jgi:glycosyltransferase involved in cell wall biosynthesis
MRRTHRPGERMDMKIALLHHSAPPVVGGVESVLERHARLMAAAGHSVRIVAARGEPVSEAVDFIRLPLVDSLHWEILTVKEELDRGRVPPAFGKLASELAAQIRSAVSGTDVLIAHNVCSLNKNLCLTEALHRLYREPDFPRLILWHHDLAWTAPRYAAELHDGMPWDLLRTDWPGAIQVAVSALRRDELAGLLRVPPDRIRVIPNGIAVEEFFKLEDRTIGFLRKLDLLRASPLLLLPVRITPRKNLELALRTLARLRETFPDAAMVVTGPIGAHNPENVEYFRRLLEMRRRLGLDSTAHFLAELEDAYLPDPVIADFYRLADALFLPSREEGFGIPVIESALSRRPVFCSDLPALRELGGDSVFYFRPDDEPETVAALVAGRLQNDPVFRLAAETRRHFTWDRIYKEKMAPLLESAVRGDAFRNGGS